MLKRYPARIPPEYVGLLVIPESVVSLGKKPLPCMVTSCLTSCAHAERLNNRRMHPLTVSRFICVSSFYSSYTMERRASSPRPTVDYVGRRRPALHEQRAVASGARRLPNLQSW